jgi:hypothetical protein
MRLRFGQLHDAPDTLLGHTRAIFSFEPGLVITSKQYALKIRLCSQQWVIVSNSEYVHFSTVAILP